MKEMKKNSDQVLQSNHDKLWGLDFSYRGNGGKEKN